MIRKSNEMKRIVTITIAILVCSATLSAQSFSTTALYEKYRGEEGIISIWVPGFAVKLAASIADLDGAEADLLRSIRSVRVLTIEDTDLYPDVNFTKEVDFKPGTNGYQLLVQVNDSGQDIMILGKQKDDKLKNLLILVGGEDNVMVHIRGRRNADMAGTIAQLAGADHISSLTKL